MALRTDDKVAGVTYSALVDLKIVVASPAAHITPASFCVESRARGFWYLDWSQGSVDIHVRQLCSEIRMPGTSSYMLDELTVGASRCPVEQRPIHTVFLQQ